MADIQEKRNNKKHNKTNYGSFDDSYANTFDNLINRESSMKRSNSFNSFLESVTLSTSKEYSGFVSTNKNNILSDSIPNTSQSPYVTSPLSGSFDKINLSSPLYSNIIECTDALESIDTKTLCLDTFGYQGYSASLNSSQDNNIEMEPDVVIYDSGECDKFNNDDVQQCVKIEKAFAVNNNVATRQNNKAIAIANQSNKLISLSLSIMLAALLQVVRCLTVMLDDTLSCLKQDMF